MSDKPQDAKIIPFNKQIESKRTFAESLLKNIDDVQHIACVVQWTEGTTQVFQTHMTKGDAAWLDYVFRKDFMDDD